MSAPLRRRSRTTLLLGAALTSTAVLAGCGAAEAPGGTGAATAVSVAPVGSSAAASPSGVPDDVEDLSAGLLPAEQFAAGGVTPLPFNELVARAQLAGGSLAGRLAGLTVTPESCTTALEAMRGAPPQPENLQGFAAQLAEGDGPTSATVEVLAAGPLVQGAVGQLTDAVEACPEVTVTVPQRGSATVGSEVLDAPDLGDGAAAVSVTATVTPAAGPPRTVAALVGVVQDGDRLVSLLSTGEVGTLDRAAFLALLEQAYEHQADALD